MKSSNQPPKYFSKTLIYGEVISVAGMVLYFYIESIESSGVALNGIGLGLWSLLGMALAGIGAAIALVSLICWSVARARTEKELNRGCGSSDAD